MSASRIHHTARPTTRFGRIHPMDPRDQRDLDELRRRRAAAEAERESARG